MANTVVGVFESAFKAEQACFELKQSGFTEDNIDISRKSNTDYSSYESGGEKTDSISKFFNNLFGNSDEGTHYSSVAEKGSVVTVHTHSREEAEVAAEILDKYGDIESNEGFNQYKENYNKDYSGDPLYKDDPSYKDRSYTGSNLENIPGTGPINEPETNANFGYTGSAMKDQNFPANDYNKGESDFKEGETIPLRESSKTIPVVEEKMKVGKSEVEGQTIRLRSRIFDKPVEENLRLREERVFVERTPVNRPATAEDMKTFKEGAIEATERSEIPLVGKEANVVEEVTIKKDVEEKMETVRGSVKRQDVDVEKKSKDKTI
jgi:stress response protein YsnF